MTDERDVLPRGAVVLLGSPRSGTTLLGHVFSAHPDVWYVNEPRLLWRYGNDHRSDSLQPRDATPQVARHIRSVLLAQLRESDRNIIVEKTPSNTLRIPFVDTVLPNTRYIHITRNAHESVAAIYEKWKTKSTGVRAPNQRQRLRRRLREATPRQFMHYAPELARRMVGGRTQALWGPRIPGLTEMVRDLPLIDVCAHQWRWCVESTLRDSPALGERFVTVELERLDEPTIEHLAQFAHMPSRGTDLMISTFRASYRRELTTGRFDSLSAWEKKRVDDIVSPTLHMMRGG